MGKTLIIIGVGFILIGILWPIFKYFNLGQLPGDFVFKGKNVTFYIPIGTCIILSLIFTLISWFLRK